MLSKIAIINVLKDNKSFKLFQEARDKEAIDKVRITEFGEAMTKDIIMEANTALSEPSPAIRFSMYKEFERSGNRLIFENAYFKRRKQLFSLVLAYVIEEDKKYIPCIEEKLWEWCELYSWELPAHFTMSQKSNTEPDKTVALFAAEMAFFLAEIISIIGEKLDEFLVYRLRNEIFRRVINPYIENEYWWEDAKMNWSSVCAGSVGAAAIYLIDDEEELASILERVINSMNAFVEAFDKDGLITEGLTYWNYGFSFYVYFSELLKERTNGNISLLENNDKITKIAQLPQILQFPSGDFVNFSDSGSERWFGDCGLFARLERLLNIKGYNYSNSSNVFSDHTSRWAAMVRKFLWSIDYINNAEKNYKTGSFYFSESQWLVDRRKTKNGEFIAFAAKGGHNDEPHNHNDLGNFILNYKGENIIIDIGSTEYVKDYFRNETRYDFLAASSLGHSVTVINDSSQMYGKDFYADVLKYEEIEQKISFILDLTHAYKCEELIKYERHFSWDFENLVLSISDGFEFNKLNNEVKEVFITEAKPEISGDGRLKIPGKNTETEFVFSRDLKCSIEQCFYKDHSSKEKSIYKIIITGNIDKNGEYEFSIRAK